MGWIPKISVACISYRSCQQNKVNFLFKTTQDFNQTRHAAPHLPIVFTDNIILYFNYLAFVLHVFKRSRNIHITLFSVTSQYMLIKPQNFFTKKHLKFYFKKRYHFRDGMTRLVINTRLFTTLKSAAMLKIIEFYWFMHSALCGWMCFEKFDYAFFGRWFCLCMIFKHGRGYRALQTVSIYFLLFYHHNIMLKTVIMLDHW